MRNFENIPPLLQPDEGLKQWEAKRGALLDTVERIEYGRRPGMDYTVTGKVRSEDAYPDANAIRRIVDITVSTKLGSHTYPMYVFIPKREKPMPATLLICSQSRVLSPMKLPEGFDMNAIPAMMARMGIVMDGPMDMGGPRKTLDMAVDMDNGHWPVPAILARGYAVAGFYATDAEPDGADFRSGIAEIFGTKKERKPEEWGVLAVWAFAARCALDCLQTMPELAADQIGVTGHSRCGKAALWAGVTDKRFAWVMPNDSGCCGSALLRGKHGENMTSINALMPYWFAPRFGTFIGRENELPFDQHTVLALVAPRLLHVASGSEDYWADPVGEHQSTVLASQVFQLYGNPAMPPEFPEVNMPETAGALGYHLRKGPHLLTEYDWMCLLDHVDSVFTPLSRPIFRF